MDLGRGPDIVDGLREVHDKIKDVREAEGGGQVRKYHGKYQGHVYRLEIHGELERKI